ncbi:hypothetical protein U6G28_11100 [Actinomycetaceae bacterium MB13-C1-2]|nr:hypothetical protein U6G28_11100 [Actinomycetaceae bacterium MB13-C1-2]
MPKTGRKFLLSLGLSAVATALVVSGFPRRSGLTAAQSLVSMPGDMVLPTAPVQADRAGTLAATADEVWPLVEDLATAYADLWDVPLQTVYESENELLVVQTDERSVDENPNEAYWRASLAIRLIPSVDGTVTVQIRERYLPNGAAGKTAAYSAMILSAVLVKKWLRGSRKHVAPVTE